MEGELYFAGILDEIMDDLGEYVRYNERDKLEVGEIQMDNTRIETNRLILRRFEENDMEAIYLLFSNEEVNTFLPMYPLKDMDETKVFFEKKLKDKKWGCSA